METLLQYMKKHKIKLIILVSIVLIVGVLLFYGKERKPFEDLQASDISSASVKLIPPDQTIQITDYAKLTKLLNEIIIYNRDDSYRTYSGQWVEFTIILTDGTKIEVGSFNPFFVINGIGYKTEYEPCEALSSYANSLLSK